MAIPLNTEEFYKEEINCCLCEFPRGKGKVLPKSNIVIDYPGP